MREIARRLFPYLALGLGVAAVTYAISFGALPAADFTWVNGTEIESVDPAKVTGIPEGRVINCLFDGLYRADPETLEPRPALAESYTVSDDLQTYTFRLRPDLKWSNGDPLTAEDVRWSWMRFLHPATAAQYSYQAYYIKNAHKFNTINVAAGDRVEVELDDRPARPDGRPQLFPQGTILRGRLVEIVTPPEPQRGSTEDDDAFESKMANWKTRWVYHVDIDGQVQRFAREVDSRETAGVTKCHWVLFDFHEVGVKVFEDDPLTLEVRLENPTPYFLQLMAFYPLYPVHRGSIEEYGEPDWTKPENLVASGGYVMEFRRIRDRIRMHKNPLYWNAENVRLETIDALAVNSVTTGLNLYMNGQADWITSVPQPVITELMGRPDFQSQPVLTTYFYRICVKKPPLDNVLIRRALNLAIDKRVICEAILEAGQQPALSLVPPGMDGYAPGVCDEFNVEEAKRLLAEAGYPGGRGMPTITILYNTLEAHRMIAERIQSDWKRNLGLNVELENQEWGVYLAKIRNLDYQVCRNGWVGDYADPNTFLDMFVTDGENNQTGWSNLEYDRLIRLATTQTDPDERMATLHQAEQILMDELPVIPIYFYVSANMVQPYVRGFYGNIQDRHDIVDMWIDREQQAALAAEGTR
jgi:oligopeptide transport system substrate-binding protein